MSGSLSDYVTPTPPPPGPPAALLPGPPANYPEGDQYDEFERKLNEWKKYNDPDGNEPDWDLQRVKDYYRIHDYVMNDVPGALAPVYHPLGPARPIPRPDPTPRSNAERAFLIRTIPDIMNNEFHGANWKGVRVLGRGGSGMVGHWSWDKTKTPLPRYCDVAVKEVNDPDKDLEEEGDKMVELGRYSEHVVRLVKNPRHVDTASEGLAPAWDGKVKRLIMEYCSQGTLSELISRRIAQRKVFQENTLWQFFECLVDGITVLDASTEYSVDSISGKARLAGDSGHWVPMVHFDMKSRNMLLEKTRNHANTPIVKIADFGLTERIHPLSGWSDREKEESRDRGTPRYYAPEQFSPRWNYADWKTSGICGEYSSATNIWGIGLAMWELTMLNRDSYLHTPFIPGIPINGAPPKGRTFAKDIQITAYSKSLKELIMETLYEIPSHRPSLKSLKERVTLGLETSNQIMKLEPWESFLAPEPQVPVAPDVAVAAIQNIQNAIVAQQAANAEALRDALEVSNITPPAPAAGPAPVARMIVYRCSHVGPDGRQCANQKSFPLGTLNPRCAVHADMNRYPI